MGRSKTAALVAGLGQPPVDARPHRRRSAGSRRRGSTSSQTCRHRGEEVGDLRASGGPSRVTVHECAARRAHGSRRGPRVRRGTITEWRTRPRRTSPPLVWSPITENAGLRVANGCASTTSCASSNTRWRVAASASDRLVDHPGQAGHRASSRWEGSRVRSATEVRARYSIARRTSSLRSVTIGGGLTQRRGPHRDRLDRGDEVCTFRSRSLSRDVGGVRIALEAGAARVELLRALGLGFTPSAGLIEAAAQAAHASFATSFIHVLVRLPAAASFTTPMNAGHYRARHPAGAGSAPMVS